VNIAALYVDRLGPYPSMLGVDAWDEARDARRYNGPDPVVAHPPCGPWGALRHESKFQDRYLALRAVEQVTRWGGVLEHPANSKLFDFASLPKPGDPPDSYGGYTVEVEQCAWGHVARKRTWLYLVGVPREALESGGECHVTHWIAGGRNPNRKGQGGFRPPGIKACSATQRRRTPKAFAEYLVRLARSTRRAKAAA
jgi:hypothetical protein